MSSGLSDAERINLKKMINESECGDNTDNIRKLKHNSANCENLAHLIQLTISSCLSLRPLITLASRNI